MRLKLATPNKFWNAKTGERNLVLAHALEKEMLLFTSPDLKTWTIEGSVGKSLGAQEGAIFPVVMSYCADFFGGIAAAVAVMTLGVIYLLFFTFIIKRADETKEEKSHPTNWYPWAIGSTVTCFLALVIGGVFGLIAMKKAKQANLYYSQGDLRKGNAEKHSGKDLHLYRLHLCGRRCYHSHHILLPG